VRAAFHPAKKTLQSGCRILCQPIARGVVFVTGVAPGPYPGSAWRSHPQSSCLAGITVQNDHSKAICQTEARHAVNDAIGLEDA